MILDIDCIVKSFKPTFRKFPTLSYPTLPYPTLPCSLLTYHILTLPCPALPCPALPCPALPCPALPCSALLCSAFTCPALPCPALLCSPLPLLALPCSPLLRSARPLLALPCPVLPRSPLPLLAGYFWMGFKSFILHFSSCYFAKLFPSAKYDYYCTRGIVLHYSVKIFHIVILHLSTLSPQNESIVHSRTYINVHIYVH